MRDNSTTSHQEYEIPRQGDVIDGRYRVQKIIGRGGMSCIVRAQQLAMQRDVAIKLLHAHVANEEATLARFEREVHLAKSLVHPNIIQYYDYGMLDSGSMYLVMELLNGCDLHALIRREGTLTLHRAIDISIQVLDGLTEAHAKSVIHRDLKPRNLFMTELNRGGDYVKILDFGIAKSMRAGESELTKTGVVCGTPSYLAPELLITQQVSPASDLYSVGLVFLEMLTGRRAFKADTMARTFFMQLRHPVPIPSGYRGTPLEKFLLYALAKHPDDRFQSAQEMIAELQTLRLQFPEDIRLDPNDIDSLVDSAASQAPGMSAIDNMGLEILRDPAWAITPTPMPLNLGPDEVSDDELTMLAEWGSKTKPSRAALRRSSSHRGSPAAQSRPAPAAPPRVEDGPKRTPASLTPALAPPSATAPNGAVAPAPASRSRVYLIGGGVLALLVALALTVGADFWNQAPSANAAGSGAAAQAPTPAPAADNEPAPDFTFVNRLDEPDTPAINAAPEEPAAAEPPKKAAEPKKSTTSQEKSAPQPEKPAPKEASPKKAPPKKAPPKKSTPKKPARRKPAPKKAAPKKAAPASIDDIMNNNTIFGDD